MDEKDYIELNKYLAGELSEMEYNAFAERIKNEPELQKEVAWQQETSAFLQRKEGVENLKNTFSNIENDFFKEEKPKTKVVNMARRKWLGLVGVAAAAALLFFIFNPFNSPDLYRQYSNPTAISLVDKSDVINNAREAEMAFNAGDYKKAYAFLSSYLSKNREDMQAYLAKGIAATEIGNYKEAEQILQNISNGKTLLKQEGTWYLALMYLKKGEIEKAKLQLQKIPAANNRYEKAKSLLQDLNE
jgi:tetratricopeptide (TPR) repeat protein